jgi:hypothetical protein
MVMDNRGRTIKENEGYLTLEGLSAYSGLSVACLRKYLARGLPHYKPGRVLVRKVDFDRWLEGFRVHQEKDVNVIVESVMESLRRGKSERLSADHRG